MTEGCRGREAPVPGERLTTVRVTYMAGFPGGSDCGTWPEITLVWLPHCPVLLPLSCLVSLGGTAFVSHLYTHP